MVIYKDKSKMLNCHQLSFSQTYSRKRIELANKTLGFQLVKKIIGFALYLLGASRRSTSEFIEMPGDTFKSFTERVETSGISAFSGCREKNPVFSSAKPEKKINPKVSVNEFFCTVDFGSGNGQMQIPMKNVLQLKVILLSLLKNKIISLKDVAEILNYSESYSSQLAERLYNDDVNVLLDHRQGQKTDYVFTSEIKSEIILQTAGNAIVGKPISSFALATDLSNRKNVILSTRSIRLHISRLGLKKISEKLPALINTLKKTQGND